MKKAAIACAVLTLLSGPAFAQNTDSFFDDKERGWFWWEVEPEPEQEEEQRPPQKSSQSPQSKEKESDTVTIGVEWLKDNLPKLRDAAIEDPNEDNLRNYAYAQRLMLDYGSRFSTEMAQFMKQDQLLDEERRRPTSAVRLASFQQKRDQSVGKYLDKIAKDAHIWFFYRSDCPYCHKQIPLLVELKEMGFRILAVSMDNGAPMRGIENFEMVVDRGLEMSRELQVVGTPSLFLVSNEKKFRYPLTSGLEPLDKIVSRIMLGAKETNMVSEQDFKETRFVNEINVFKNQDTTIKAEKQKLEDDPGYLSELLRSRLEKNTGL